MSQRRARAAWTCGDRDERRHDQTARARAHHECGVGESTMQVAEKLSALPSRR